MTTTEVDPQTIIADAEQEEREAAELVATLEEKVRDGDEAVTFEEVDKARGLLSFVRLRQEAARRKAAKAQEAARLAACEALHADIQEHAKGEGTELAKQLQEVVEAISAFSDAVETRNNRIIEYRDRAVSLGIPEHKNPTAPPAAHGKVGIMANASASGIPGVIAGMRKVEQIDRDVFLNRALDLLLRAGKYKHMDNVDAGTDLFGDLAGIDAESEGPKGNHFYVAPNGSVHARDIPFTPEEMARSQLKEVSKDKAYGE